MKNKTLSITLKLILSSLIILTIAACSNVQAISPTQQESSLDPIQQYKISNSYNPPIENYISK
ncbi:hypothetical protein [uncultured Metabacillus sp.]|uniref:hypothetical protein n=1 Tax=uncultured Metabacillus sp. TaxID=2860135 RepID=UPI00262AE1CD|nr:hypothetical protein [uncultured Metabacillus sp.]